MAASKTALITLKVAPSLAELVDNLPNKSEFIRNAILAALRNTCPLCQGSGVLTPEQLEHWETFTKHHKAERCDDCRAVHLRCDYVPGRRSRGI